MVVEVVDEVAEEAVDGVVGDGPCVEAEGRGREARSPSELDSPRKLREWADREDELEDVRVEVEEASGRGRRRGRGRPNGGRTLKMRTQPRRTTRR